MRPTCRCVKINAKACVLVCADVYVGVLGEYVCMLHGFESMFSSMSSVLDIVLVPVPVTVPDLGQKRKTKNFKQKN